MCVCEGLEETDEDGGSELEDMSCWELFVPLGWRWYLNKDRLVFRSCFVKNRHQHTHLRKHACLAVFGVLYNDMSTHTH